MAQTAQKYSAQFKEKLVEMVRAGHSPSELAQKYTPSAKTIQRWYQQAVGSGEPDSGRQEQQEKQDQHTDQTPPPNEARMPTGRQVTKEGQAPEKVTKDGPKEGPREGQTPTKTPAANSRAPAKGRKATKGQATTRDRSAKKGPTPKNDSASAEVPKEQGSANPVGQPESQKSDNGAAAQQQSATAQPAALAQSSTQTDEPQQGAPKKAGNADKDRLKRGRKWLRKGDEVRRRRGAEAALPAYTEAIELLEMAARDSDDKATRREWGIALERLGDAVFATEGPGAALTYYEQWHEVAEALVAEHGGIQARQDWSTALQRLARAIEISDSPERALTYYRQAAELCEELANEQHDTGQQDAKYARLSWAQALDRLAVNVERVAGTESALPHFRRALSLREELCGSSTTLPAQIPQNLAQQLAREAAAHFAQMHQGMFEHTTTGYAPRPALSYGQTSPEEGYLAQHKRHTGESGAAPAHAQVGSHADSGAYSSGSATGDRHRVEAFDAAEDPGQPLVDRGLEHARRGDQLYEHSGPGAAIPAYRRAIELLEEAARTTEEAETCREWGVTLERLGDALLEEEGPDEALPYYQHWCEIAETLAAEQNSVRAYRDYSVALSRVGYALHSSEAPQAAMSYYQKALELREELAAEQGTTEAKKDWALALERFGSVIEEVDGAQAALPRYMQALELRREVAERQPQDIAARRAYGLANERAGMAVLTANGPEESLPYFQALADVFTQLEEELGTREAAEEREKADTMLGKVQMAVM
ncbi:hypothetical protein LRD18_07430 [Halorhodospira halochloris]|uniref:hypothetical protein n=1 Tax=Halorhodospira halochloris TaxID=1052 RepID=UPI001EE8FF44|nr:hypothetical protein [Halorhodospira halochloris]MCG5530706.1 hypothetical protein [Halorhodospira halochloris]